MAGPARNRLQPLRSWLWQASLPTTDVPQVECRSGPGEPLSGGTPPAAVEVETTVHGVNGQIARYHADGTPAPFSGLGTNAIDARKGPGGKECGEEPASCDVPTPPAAEGLRSPTPISSKWRSTNRAGRNRPRHLRYPVLDHLADVFSPTGAYLGQLTEY